jgi:hypothetical protein
MAMPPLNLELSNFEQLEIVRQEIEAREGELGECEKNIRTLLWELERLKYLRTVHPFFQNVQPPGEAGKLAELQAHRETLSEALAALKAAVAVLEKETKGQVRPPSRQPAVPARPGAGPRKAGFDSFEEFRDQRRGHS